MHLDPETTELLRLVLHSLSLELGRKVALKEALVMLLAQRLQIAPVTETAGSSRGDKADEMEYEKP
ncbi:MAG: hypothetical protein AB7S38_35190 [Vulcanimicrobiota bacterium]